MLLLRQAHAELTAAGIVSHCALADATRTLLQRAAERLGWTGRGLHRVLKVARTIADLAACAAIALDPVGRARPYQALFRLSKLRGEPTWSSAESSV